MERERSSSAVERVRESVDKLRSLPLDEIDKDLYELECLREEREAAAGNAASSGKAPTLEDDVAISEAIHEVECELEEEKERITALSLARGIVNSLFYIALIVAFASYYLQNVDPKLGEVVYKVMGELFHVQMVPPVPGR